MASAYGIKVEVQTDGQGLRCYDDPDEAPNGKPGVVKKYIEAVTDATFMIGISLTRDFSFGKCDGIKASVIMHGRDVGMCFIPQKASYDMDRQPKMVYTAPYEYCAASGKWRRCTWSFAKLNIQETADVETPSPEIKHLGIVTVSLQRVYQVDCRPIPTRREKEHQWITEIPEKHLKGKAISNSISIVKGSITTEPPPLKHRYVPITGQMGESMEFTFLYRSKHALQLLGCIPRTPSPNPEPELSFNSEGDNTQATSAKTGPALSPSDRDQKITALKAQLALLERNPNIKPETSPNSLNIPSSASSSPQAGIKREYDGVEVMSQWKRARLSGPIETVDLTDD